MDKKETLIDKLDDDYSLQKPSKTEESKESKSKNDF